jgi:hypothetical protein
VDWTTFRALETFAILYDIQIDEEEYDCGACHILKNGGLSFVAHDLFRDDALGPPDSVRPWESPVYVPLPLEQVGAQIGQPSVDPVTLGERLPGWEWPNAGAVNLDADDSTAGYWRLLLSAKRQRAGLMSVGMTAADEALEHVGAAVLKHMPELPDELRDGTSAAALRENLRGNPHDYGVGEPLQRLLLRVLFLLEAAACYVGYHSIAHAEEADTTLRNSIRMLCGDTLTEEERLRAQSPYQFVARYDKGVGEHHIPLFAKAHSSLHAVATDLAATGGCIPDAVECFRPPEAQVPAWLSHVRWTEVDAQLFRAFVGYQAAIQSAEALNKMQRSSEALECLALMPGESITSYQGMRRQLLRHRFMEDRRDTTEALPSDEAFAGRRRQYGQMLSEKIAEKREELDRGLTRVKDLLAKVQGGGADMWDGPVAAQMSEAEESAQMLLDVLRQRIENSVGDQGEFDQAVHQWASALEMCVSKAKGLAVFEDKNPGDSAHQAATVALHLALRHFEAELPESARFGEVNSLAAAADDLVSDPRYRDYKAGLRSAVSAAVWDLCVMVLGLLGRTKPAWCEDDTVENLREYARGRFAGDSTSTDFSQFHRHLASSRLSVLGGDLLPSSAGGDGRHAQRDLRRFIVERFLLPGSSVPRSHLLGPVRPRCAGGLRPCRRSYRCLDKPVCPDLDQVARDNPLVIRHEPKSDELTLSCDEVATGYQERIDKSLNSSGHGCRTPSGWGLAVLQRWNSFTPAFGASEGGGYLLYHRSSEAGAPDGRNGIGLAIDPGYGFVKNLLAERFGIPDITAVAVTHDHPDHLADFEALHTLMHEASQPKTPGIELLVSEGALRHLEPIVENSKVIGDTRVLSCPPGLGDPVSVCFVPSGADGTVPKLKVRATPALHRDLTLSSRADGYDSLGLKLEIIGGGAEQGALVGLPSDTVWSPKIAAHYSDCGVVCLHLGSISKRGGALTDFFREDRLQEILLGANHLFLPGVYWFIAALGSGSANPPLVVLSEFGEELSGGLRTLIAEALNSYHRSVRVVAGDVGLVVDPVDRSLRCSCCDRFYPWTVGFRYEVFGDSEQIFYVCPSCADGLSYDQKASIFRRKQTPLMRMVMGE